MFYLPYETIPLPDGNEAMQKSEQEFQKYQDKRLEEESQRLMEEQENGTPTRNESASRNDEADILMSKTRERLENLYINSAEEPAVVEEIKAAEAEAMANDEASAQAKQAEILARSYE